MELSISKDAANEFKKSVESVSPQPYLRVGAKKGELIQNNMKNLLVI